jgi:cell division ATPase FtsA
VNENRITGNVAIISNPIYASALGLLLYEGNESYLEVVQLSEKTGLLDKIKGKFREF